MYAKRNRIAPAVKVLNAAEIVQDAAAGAEWMSAHNDSKTGSLQPMDNNVAE